MNQIFTRTGAVKPPRSGFNLSYDKKFDADMGYLYVVMADEVLPGDYFKNIAYEAVIRAQPLEAPIMHQIDVYVHYFFVPYRLVWDDWEKFITGDKDGNDTTTIPTWTPSAAAKRNKGTLWDFIFGVCGVTPASGSLPIDMPRRAYMMIFNEFYRDEMLTPEIDFLQSPGSDLDIDGNALTGAGDEDLQLRAWTRDYFTAARPDQSLGDAPALPVTIQTDDGNIDLYNSASSTERSWQLYTTAPVHRMSGAMGGDGFARFGSNVGLEATTFNAADFRLAWQIQRWQERNMRAGVRYEEFIKAHWGIDIGDHRAAIPIYIGGGKQPVIVSEVLGTNQDNTVQPQGTLGGHGISVERRSIGSYSVKEYGLIMGIMSIIPKPTYDQGIQRQWTKYTRYDYYTPEFANLSEQAILEKELYVSTSASNNETVFGYTGAWDEYRVKHGMLAGELHTETAGPGGAVPGTLAYWHLGQLYSARPALNQEFIECVPRDDAWAAPSTTQWIVNFANLLTAIRPMPAISEPGLLDH